MKKFIITTKTRQGAPNRVTITVDDADAYLLRSYEWVNRNGYIQRSLGGCVTKRLSHDITGAAEGDVVTYLDGNTFNLTRANLKRVTRAEFYESLHKKETTDVANA